MMGKPLDLVIMNTVGTEGCVPGTNGILQASLELDIDKGLMASKKAAMRIVLNHKL